MRCDLLVLGDTPDAWAAARDAARLGARSIVLRPETGSRGVATETSALLSAFGEECEFPLAGKSTCGPVRPSDLCAAAALAHQRRVTQTAREYGIKSWRGSARLTGPATADIFTHGAVTRVEAKLILIALGTTARRPAAPALERSTLILPEEVASRHDVPPRLVVLGGNQTARACARLYSAAGSEVTIIDAARAGVAGLDARVLHDEVVECRQHGRGAAIRLATGRMIETDAIVFAARRMGATHSFGLAAAGLEADDRGRLWCDDFGMTWVPTIAAAGEVIGYPRNLRENRQRIGRTISAYLGLRDARRESVISIRIEQPAPTPEPASEGSRARTKPRPRPRLRVFHGQ